ncbi:MAG: hypothetical protein ACE5H1_01930 [Thermodesulfobacteriota bacterium]
MAKPTKKIADNFDVSTGDKDFDSGKVEEEKVTTQLIWSSLTGTLDGVVKLQGSNDEVNYDDLGLSKTLNSASNSHSFIDFEFGHEFLRAKLTVNGLTGGNLTIIIKPK